MSTRRTAARLAAAAATAALITSCSAGHDTAEKTPGRPRTAPVADAGSNIDKSAWPKAVPDTGLAKGLSLPLQAYMQTYEDTVTLDNAERHLETSCMAGYGFHVTFPPAGQTPPPSADDANMPRRYGITDRALAEKYGYGLPEESQKQQGTRMPGLTQDQVEVLTGRTGIRGNLADPAPKAAPGTYRGKQIHKDGCAGWADDRLGTRDLDFSLVSELDGRSLTRSRATPAVQNAITAWSTCMSTKGYTVATPYDADKVVPHVDMNPSQEEINVALADIDCKKTTDLVRIWFDAESTIQRQQIEDHRSELDALRARNTDALAAAKTALNG
ncbi:hypothetical protein [Streptomyces olindensis]|uniref:hypothetical protein n=1 Tax=Streptomyces olindensis TaxID=358823 RepID=UPI0033E4C088